MSKVVAKGRLKPAFVAALTKEYRELPRWSNIVNNFLPFLRQVCFQLEPSELRLVPASMGKHNSNQMAHANKETQEPLLTLPTQIGYIAKSLV